MRTPQVKVTVVLLLAKLCNPNRHFKVPLWNTSCTTMCEVLSTWKPINLTSRTCPFGSEAVISTFIDEVVVF